ncbi:hypothetical protein Pcac1_g5843 [Phytophthora cactorum]|nr:hypothetical protein Pcac1_g5843 [Phytophthora cactorum]
MEALTKAVETTIGEEMPDDFGLIIDGWTHGTEHYLAAYGCYETTDGRPKYPLLSLAPVMDEPDDHLNADGHMMAISCFLPFFGKSLDGCRFWLVTIVQKQADCKLASRSAHWLCKSPP